jgi:hypothetical protein
MKKFKLENRKLKMMLQIKKAYVYQRNGSFNIQIDSRISEKI